MSNRVCKDKTITIQEVSMNKRTTRYVLKVLKKRGYVRTRVNGSHAIYQKGGITVPVKVTEKEIPPGTLSSIKRITGLSFD